MGKQLHFAHTEEDIFQFLIYLEKLRCKIIINGNLSEPSGMLTQIVSEMSIYRNPQYSVVYVPDDSYVKTAKEARIADGTAIEVMNCWKWSDNKHTYYDKGRIYLAKTKEGTYDVPTLAIYKKLCAYFKKNYAFQKQLDVYFSNTFEKQYYLGTLYLSQLGHPFPSTNS